MVLQPPKLADFSGNYSAWAARQATESQRRHAKPPSQNEKVRAKRDSAKANAYLRPYGRLEPKELEHQITQTEIELAECQQMFADAENFKSGKSRDLYSHFDALIHKLEESDEKYFAR